MIQYQSGGAGYSSSSPAPAHLNAVTGSSQPASTTSAFLLAGDTIYTSTDPASFDAAYNRGLNKIGHNYGAGNEHSFESCASDGGGCDGIGESMMLQTLGSYLSHQPGITFDRPSTLFARMLSERDLNYVSIERAAPGFDEFEDENPVAAAGVLAAVTSGAGAVLMVTKGTSSNAAEESTDAVQVSRTADGAVNDGPGISLDDARAAAERNGIDTRWMDLNHKPGAPGQYGFTSFNGAGGLVRGATGRFQVTLTDLGLNSEEDSVNTIAHELNHIREGLATGDIRPSEDPDIQSGNPAESYFR